MRRVYVEDLFGHFNYDLFISKPNIPPTLLILYGDNGCGKTTLLQMVFHLLNPERKGGHKSFLAKRIFKRFELELTNGTLIAAERPAGRVVGGFLTRFGMPKGKHSLWSGSPMKMAMYKKVRKEKMLNQSSGRPWLA